MDVIDSVHGKSAVLRMFPAGIDAVMVDLDGTLVDTLGDFAEAVNRTLDGLQLPAVAAEEIALRVGKGSEHLLHSVLDLACAQTGRTLAADVPDALYPRAWSLYLEHYEAVNGRHAAVFPGVPEGLAHLRQAGLRLVCLTNKPRAHALALLQGKRLDGYFEAVFGGDSFERKKPDPLPLRKTCAWLDTAPGRTLMLGDSSNDAQAARAAGCPVVLVTYGYNHGRPVQEAAADAYVDSLTQLLAR